MNTRILLTVAVTALVIGSASIGSTAQAAVAGPTSSTQSAAQSLSLTDQVRRICRSVLVCGKFGQGCRWQQSCYVTKDYPPEHGRR